MKMLKKFYFDHRYIIYCLLSLPVWFSLISKQFYNSDCAFGYLAGQDFARGNIFLKDWVIGNDSFYTTDYFWQGIFSLFIPDMVLCAHIFSLTIILASYFVINKICDNAYRKIYNSTFNNDRYSDEIVFFISTLALIALSNVIIFTPGRGATIFFSLLSVCCLLGDSKSKNYYFYIVFSTIALSGDGYSFIYLFIPLLFLYFYEKFFKKSTIFPMLLLFCPVFFAAILRYVLQKYGYINPALALINTVFIPFEEFPSAVSAYVAALCKVFHAWFWGGNLFDPNTWVSLFFFSYLCLIIASCFFCKRYSQLQYFLIFSAVSFSLICLFSTINIPSRPRYFAGIVINCLPFLYFSFYEYRKSHYDLNFTFLKFLPLLSILILIIFNYTQTVAPNIIETKKLASTLSERGHKAGYGDFWSSSSTTFYGNGTPIVSALAYTGTGYTPYRWMVNLRNYDDFNATFVVIYGQPKEFSYSDIINSFGNPDEILTVGRYKAFLYKNKLNNMLK